MEELVRRLIFGVCCVCFVFSCAFLGMWLINGHAAKSRNQELAKHFHAERENGSEAASASETQQQSQPQGKSETQTSERMFRLMSENEDFAAWLYVEGTGIDYPVVRHSDNDYYLNKNFWKEDDRYGAIFMDCANSVAFDSPHTILYGHNMKDGAMFGTLSKYLNAEYLSENPTITITLPDEAVLTYRIFAARKTTAEDAAYKLDFASDAELNAFASELGAPISNGEAGYLLTLSTCASGTNRAGRVLVHALRI